MCQEKLPNLFWLIEEVKMSLSAYPNLLDAKCEIKMFIYGMTQFLK